MLLFGPWSKLNEIRRKKSFSEVTFSVHGGGGEGWGAAVECFTLFVLPKIGSYYSNRFLKLNEVLEKNLSIASSMFTIPEGNPF